jgi:uncharacterized RDD family membrane protein YckC
MSTPEPPPDFTPATKAPTQVLGRRTVAIIIDGFVLLAIYIVIAAVLGDVETDDGFQASTGTGGTFLFLLIGFLYFCLLEGGPGRTVGKVIMGIRVQMADGSPSEYGPAAIRTLMRLVDGLFFYFVGWIAALASGPRRQRLGDMLGKTSVVRAR